jgi:hypothetical protein
MSFRPMVPLTHVHTQRAFFWVIFRHFVKNYFEKGTFFQKNSIF